MKEQEEPPCGQADHVSSHWLSGNSWDGLSIGAVTLVQASADPYNGRMAEKLSLSPVDAGPSSLLLISLPTSTAIPPKRWANDGSDPSIQLGRGPMVSLPQQEVLRVGEVGKGLIKETPRHPSERRSASKQRLPVAPGASLHASGPSGPLSSLSLCSSHRNLFRSRDDLSAPHQIAPCQHRSLPLLLHQLGHGSLCFPPQFNPSKPCLHFSSCTQMKFSLLGVRGIGLHWFGPG